MKFPKRIDFTVSPLGSLWEEKEDDLEKKAFFKEIWEFASKILGKIGTNPLFHYYIFVTTLAGAVTHENIWTALVSTGFAGTGTYLVSANMKNRKDDTASYTTEA